MLICEVNYMTIQKIAQKYRNVRIGKSEREEDLNEPLATEILMKLKMKNKNDIAI